MNTNGETYWVLAAPTKLTYAELSSEDIAEQYNKMAFEEFDKQFRKKPETESISEDSILVSNCRTTAKLKKTTIELEMEKWGDIPVNASLYALIYTLQNGSPRGEATYIRKVDGDVNIAADLIRFYEKFNWHAEKPSLSNDINPRMIQGRPLDDIILPKIMDIYFQ